MFKSEETNDLKQWEHWTNRRQFWKGTRTPAPPPLTLENLKKRLLAQTFLVSFPISSYTCLR